MTSFEICSFEAFVSEATPQASSLEEAASAQEILIQQIESYLSRLSTALCTDMRALENLTVDTFLQLTDTPGSYVGQGLRVLRVDAGETGVEFVQLIHSSLIGLGADDHLQYLLLAGRAGGQAAFGGTAATEVLALRGSTDADLGFVDILSPIRIDVDWSVTSVLDVIRWDTTIPSSGAAVTGFMRLVPTVTVDSGLFIFSTIFDQGLYLQTVAPGFAVHTLFLGQPRLQTTTAAVQPNQVFILAAQPQVENNGAGILGTAVANVDGMTFTPQLIARFAGDTLSIINMTAALCSPAFSTVAGSTVSFGTIRGLDCRQPAVGLFQPGLGVELMTAYIGLDFAAMTFGGNVTKSVVRSFLASASNARFLDNRGTAESDFGAGDIHLDDNTGLKFGTGVANPDIFLFWDTATNSFRFSPFFGTGGNPLDFTGTAADEWILGGPGLGDIGLGFDVNAIVFGTALPTPNALNTFVLFAAPNLRQVQFAGEYSDVRWTAGGSIDVNGLAVTDLQAFKIDAPAVILNGGTIADFSNVFIDSMPSFPTTRRQALRVLGRTRGDGLQCHNEATLAQLTANVVQLTLPANNLGRFVLLEDADALGPWTIQGILNVQVGDCFYIINTGANAFLLGHQDGAAAAIDRIISPTGAAITLGQDEMAKLWYDPVATRWRILETTGA